MLATESLIESRRSIASGALEPLASSLAADLDRLLPDEDVFVPVEKARMTRRGGRCERDGAFLEFDPTSPRRHRCPVCGNFYEGDDHYRWWIMGYQLWLAERAVHASVLWRLVGNDRHRRLGESILGRLSDHYLRYPNEDNVLGPTRVFFSTYLESIWSLQLATATWLLEGGTRSPLGDSVRDRILEPSSALVASFNEGHSNRQVWNSAALAAAGALLDQPRLIERAMTGPGSLEFFLRTGLFDDGSWYEGENYHLFAHRGLWYLVRQAENAGFSLPAGLLERFQRGFVAPIRTALPDFTFPSRRDSQYRVSLRQWRIAESLELGLAATPDSPELGAGLAAVYADAPEGDSARWRSTAEAERNVPGVRLTRADLGWKSLLFALPAASTREAEPMRSALMEGQGVGVIRAERGRVYVALDYGHPGGSHGHPDRLNFWLVTGDQRIFEDVGTGSYVERTLHWYRSTLAHNAPLIDGRSQEPVTGTLRAWDARDGYAWIDAEAPITAGTLVRRTVVVADGHVVDRLEWSASHPVTLDLPMHVDAEVEGARWEPDTLVGASGLEDGFEFLSDVAASMAELRPARVHGAGINGVVDINTGYTWWRARAPGPPGQQPRAFLITRATASQGCITSVWSWRGAVDMSPGRDASFTLTVDRKRVTHRMLPSGWSIQPGDGTEILLGGLVAAEPPRTTDARSAPRAPIAIPRVSLPDIAVGRLTESRRGLSFALGEKHYRRTESTWSEADAPTAVITLGATDNELLVEASINKPVPYFAEARDENPLDNEHPDVNSDGMQVHLTCAASGNRSLTASWLLVPESGSSSVRVHGRDDANAIRLEATWRRTSTGWELLARIDRKALGAPEMPLGLDVIINEQPRERERRRGQLVLSANAGDWAYLRGDRQDRERLVPMVIGNA